MPDGAESSVARGPQFVRAVTSWFPRFGSSVKEVPIEANIATSAEDSENPVIVTDDSPPPKVVGWKAVEALYTDNQPHMETDFSSKAIRYSFLAGVFLGGYGGYAASSQRYDMHKEGKTILSKRDALRRRWDYAVVMFAKRGFSVGIKCAAIVGSVVALSTHLSVLRGHFSWWYFPVISASVGSLAAFPLGLLGSMKAFGFGLSSGCSISAMIYLYALNIDKTVRETYDYFKWEYEKDLRAKWEDEETVTAYMKEHDISWRGTARKKMKLADEPFSPDNRH